MISKNKAIPNIMEYIAKQSIIRLCKCSPRSKDKHAYLRYTYHKANVPDVQGIRRKDGRAAMEKESKTCLCVANEKNVGRETKGLCNNSKHATLN